MNFLERYLTLWVLLCIVVGVALGHWFARYERGHPKSPADTEQLQ